MLIPFAFLFLFPGPRAQPKLCKPSSHLTVREMVTNYLGSRRYQPEKGLGAQLGGGPPKKYHFVPDHLLKIHASILDINHFLPAHSLANLVASNKKLADWTLHQIFRP